MAKEYIEREVVSEGIRKYYYKNPPNSSYQEGFDRGLDKAQRVILDAPVADVVEVRHGRWCWVAYDANPKIGNWHCTYCNRIPKSFQKEDFCPNCGAKMDKEDAWKDDALEQKED